MPLPQPKGRQKEVLYLPAEGHWVVLGTAGSGKTTLAIHRAKYLGNPKQTHCGPTLLLTYNRALLTYLTHLGEGLLENVTVETYHKFARGYLHSRGMMGNNWIAGRTPRDRFIQNAVEQLKLASSSRFLERPVGFFSEEIGWIQQNGLATLDDYVAAERVGRRSVRVQRVDRPVVWDVLEQYLAARETEGYRYDWADIATAVRRAIARDDTTRRYHHIIIDEGQDFSPEMLRSLAELLPADGSLTFFGDMAQQIFGHRLSWRAAGLNPPSIWNFEQNYRNTKQIADLAIAISKMPYYQGEEDLVPPDDVTADGAKPTVVSFPDRDREINFLLRQAKDAAVAGSVAILVRRREDERLFRGNLPGALRLHRNLDRWVDGPGVYYGTYHSAKGLEFDTVILPFLSEDYLPDGDEVTTLGPEEAAQREGRLLYVGVTRARTALIITHTGPLSKLVPNDPELLEFSGDAP